MIGILNILPALVLAAAPGKLAPAVSKEMTEAIVAVNKALGLESWPAHGATSCLDRGGQGITAKDVTPEDTRKCAATVLEIQWAAIGPATVIAIGVGDGLGWGAYSCDPTRKCNPVKLGLPAKWSKRTTERQAKACADAATIWFPADGNKSGCPGSAATPASELAPSEPAKTSPAQTSPAPSK